MGGAMAANLARGGYSVKAWNRTPNRPGAEVAASAGATVVSSIREAVKAADIIFTCVGDVPDVEEVILETGGVAESAKPGALVIDTEYHWPRCCSKNRSRTQQAELALSRCADFWWRYWREKMVL